MSAGAVLFGLTLPELRELVAQKGWPSYTAQQIAEWLYRHRVSNILDMTNLSKAARQELAANYTLGVSPPIAVQVSKDGTRKYVFETLTGDRIESVWIPDRERSTLCVSTQVGCRVCCRFCRTGRMGFRAHLTVGEIINQYRSLPEFDRVENLVFMGMGEPLDNLENVLQAVEILCAPWGFALSPRRITISTVGRLPELLRLLQETQCHVAVSLHSPFPEERARLVPAERQTPIREVVAALRTADFTGQRRLMFEYIVFHGLNDSRRHVRELTRLLNGLPCRINLMRYHPLPGGTFPPTDEAALLEFQAALRQKGFRVTIRRSRGEDICAACGQLATALNSSTQCAESSNAFNTSWRNVLSENAAPSRPPSANRTTTNP